MSFFLPELRKTCSMSKNANVKMAMPDALLESHSPLIVGLVASVERILQVRETRLQAFDRQSSGDDYIDRASIQQELAWTRKLCRENNWPLIDVSRKSVETVHSG